MGKNIHRISNSVIHQRSYTNIAIADISPGTPRLGDDIAALSADVTKLNADIVTSKGKCSCFMFHNVSLAFHDVLWVVHNFFVFHNFSQ